MRDLSVLPLVILLLVFAPNTYAQKKLAIVGSSTSACVGPSDPNNCYVARLKTYFNKVSPYDTIIDNSYDSYYSYHDFEKNMVGQIRKLNFDKTHPNEK